MNITSQPPKRNSRQGIRRMVITMFALCLPVIAATIFSGTFFHLTTIQAGQMNMMDMAGMSGQMASASGSHSADPNYIPDGASIITLNDYGFSPATVTVQAGSVVAWVNSSKNAQSVQVTKPVLFGSASLKTGNTFQYIFTSPGTYPFKTQNGTYAGNVVVTDASQPAETGTPEDGTITPGPGCTILANASISIVSGGGFSPTPLNVSAGTSVTWTNNSGARARVRDISHFLFDSGDLQSGQTFSYTFCNSGTYQYENSRANTTGVVVVGGGGSTATAIGTTTGTPESTTTGTPETTVTGTPESTTTGTPGTAVPTATSNPGTINIFMQRHDVFSPNDVTISTGTTVRWTNQDDEQHTTTSDDGLWNSGALNQGQFFEYTFLAPGDYHYICLIHGAEMSGWVHVTGDPISPTPGGTATASPTTVQGGTLDVSIQNFAFQPNSVTILVGTTVRWTNNDSTAHTTTSSTGVWNSGNLAPGAQFSYTFNTAGTYAYSCLIHPGMQGTINVVTSLPTGTPTVESTTTPGTTNTPGTTTTTTPETTTTPDTTTTPQTTLTAQPSTTGTAQATETETPSPTPGTVNAAIQNYAFSPITITVQLGTTVKWTNLDNDNHTITSVDNLFTSGILAINQSWQYMFNTPGTYAYYCQVHGIFMTGYVVVEAPNACQAGFSDVQVGSTFYEYVQCLTCQSIVGGYSDGTFRPNNTITRGQLAKIVSNAAGYTDTPTGQTFTDVPVDSTFYLYAERMAIHEVLTGYPDGTFRPGSNATRGQIAKIVSNAKGLNTTPASQTFQDVTPDNTFYLYVERLVSVGAMNGYPCGGTGEPCGTGNLPYFRPGTDATRGQVTKIVSTTFFPNCPQ